MLAEVSFLNKFSSCKDLYPKSGLIWNDLVDIYNDFVTIKDTLTMEGNQIAEYLRLNTSVHSVKSRVKDPEHLIEKIIRKKVENPERELSIDTYRSEITDLIGVRVIHLYKGDWGIIHEYINSKWQPIETRAYIRDGDDTVAFNKNDIEIKRHSFGYRSVHYLIKTITSPVITEIQVRTIFEEGWSEIDHDIRYPYLDIEALNTYLVLFNRFSGIADEMGTFIKYLKCEMEKRDKDNDLYKVNNIPLDSFLFSTEWLKKLRI